jgi:hypothetical protein
MRDMEFSASRKLKHRKREKIAIAVLIASIITILVAILNNY